MLAKLCKRETESVEIFRNVGNENRGSESVFTSVKSTLIAAT